MYKYRSYFMYPQNYNIEFSQNFLKSPELSKEVVDLMGIISDDLVIEIGPGKGALTQYILPLSKKVIAVEKDKELCMKLREKYEDSKLEVVNQDFLTYQLPQNESYKVIGNIPFVISTEVVKKVLSEVNPPIQTALFVQKEFARRIM